MKTLRMLTITRYCSWIAVAAMSALFACAGASAASRPTSARELPTSPSWEQGNFAALVPGTTYQASRVTPTPTIRPQDGGWSGTQVVTHQAGKVRYESAAFLGHQGEIDLTSGPAMKLSPAAALAAPRARSRDWNFAPYDPPGPVKRWTLVGRSALYFDATAPPPGVWTLVGSNPPELRIEHDHSFRMAALSVRGKTVVIVIQAAATDFAKFLPVAQRLLVSLRFPS